jgi:hypothetical protein
LPSFPSEVLTKEKLFFVSFIQGCHHFDIVVPFFLASSVFINGNQYLFGFDRRFFFDNL